MPGGSALRGVPCRHHRLWGPGCHRRRSLIAVKGPVTTASSSARPPATNSATCSTPPTPWSAPSPTTCSAPSPRHDDGAGRSSRHVRCEVLQSATVARHFRPPDAACHEQASPPSRSDHHGIPRDRPTLDSPPRPRDPACRQERRRQNHRPGSESRVRRPRTVLRPPGVSLAVDRL